MSQLCAALVQTNVSVGALKANADKVARLAREAREGGAQVIVFPELVLSGYPPEDLVLKKHFREDCQIALEHAAAGCPHDAIVVVGTPITDGEACYNGAAVLHGGKVVGYYGKMLLPNYGVFDEKRVFASGRQPAVIDVAGLRIGLHICEDSWFHDDVPCTSMRDGGVDLVINISASPYFRRKTVLREEVMRATATTIGAPLLYCNLIGGQDELVFDGASMAFDGAGKLIARGKQFEEQTLYVSLDLPVRKSSKDWKFASIKVPILGKGRVGTPLPTGSNEDGQHGVPSLPSTIDDFAEVWAALRLGLRDYVDKNGFRAVVVAVSGGIDSALVLALAVDALGADRVHAVTMPSKFSSADTLSDAHLIAKNLGVNITTVPIKRLHELYLEELTPLWPGRDPDATEENIQARIRGAIIMALSNKFGWLVLTTGNKSELATGYCTLYGDMAGGFALIKDVPKTLVFELSRWHNRHAGRELIPVSTIDRPPSAELRANQKDQDSLPPYDVLDQILERYVEQDQSADEIRAAGFDHDTVRRVIRLVDGNEYKRRQGAPGVKITPKAFGRDRRLPITNLYGERVRP